VLKIKNFIPMKNYLGLNFFFLISATFIVFFLYLALEPINIAPFYVKPTTSQSGSKKYILFWGSGKKPSWMGQGNTASENCVFTLKKDYLHSVDEYDAIVFNLHQSSDIPKLRKQNQSYIMMSME
jgi:hypothetical protein